MKRLLLVDDNIEFLELLSGVLNKHFHIYKATGVQEALRVIETATVDAICSDFNMRDGTGLELLEQLRSKGVQIPFLLMSGDDDFHLANMVRGYGAAFACKTDWNLLDKIKQL